MTLHELLRELQALADQGHGDKEVAVFVRNAFVGGMAESVNIDAFGGEDMPDAVMINANE